MLVLEAAGISGVGLFFASFGALTIGVLLHLDIIAQDATLSQFAYFVAATAGWTILLWKPISRFYSSRNQKGYHNIVGDTAFVGSEGLSKKAQGEVTWSGTIMKAKMAEDADAEELEAGTQVEITDMQGVTLIVKPK